MGDARSSSRCPAGREEHVLRCDYPSRYGRRSERVRYAVSSADNHRSPADQICAHAGDPTKIRACIARGITERGDLNEHRSERLEGLRSLTSEPRKCPRVPGFLGRATSSPGGERTRSARKDTTLAASRRAVAENTCSARRAAPTLWEGRPAPPQWSGRLGSCTSDVRSVRRSVGAGRRTAPSARELERRETSHEPHATS